MHATIILYCVNNINVLNLETSKAHKILLSISRRLYKMAQENNHYIFSNTLVELFSIHAKMPQRLNKDGTSMFLSQGNKKQT